MTTKAAEKALQEGLSFPDTLRRMQPGTTRMPGYRGLAISVNEQHLVDGDTMNPRSIEDINRYRDLLGQTTRQSALAESRLLGLVDKLARRPPPPPSQGYRGGETGRGDGGEAGAARSNQKLWMAPYHAKFENEDLVRAQALPGRRISRDTMRRGWLYVNTWYMIGPWDTFGLGDFSLTHPPEQGIDFDAVYRDGQTGTGIAERDAHPLKITGKKVTLDGSLGWQFMQSESMHNTVPVTTDNSTYYAYTELFFDEPATMIVAIGTDDSGKLWINDREIWQDTGMSWYHLDEHIEAFPFQAGWNRVLIRLENNGGAATGFSFLICPQDVALAEPKKPTS